MNKKEPSHNCINSKISDSHYVALNHEMTNFRILPTSEQFRFIESTGWNLKSYREFIESAIVKFKKEIGYARDRKGKRWFEKDIKLKLE